MSRKVIREGGNTAGNVEVYLGLYRSCHMNGPTALPIQYAESIMALTVTLFVWPAVTLESQDNDSTKLVVPTPAQVSKSERDSYKDPHQ